MTDCNYLGEIIFIKIIENKINDAKTEMELDTIRDDIEKSCENSDEKQYLLNLLSSKYLRFDAQKRGKIEEEWKRKIEICRSEEEAIRLRNEINNDSAMNMRSKYGLLRELKENVSIRFANTIAMGDKIDSEMRSSAFVTAIVFFIGAIVCCLINDKVSINWINKISGWGIYICLAIVALSIVMFLYYMIQWLLSSSEQRSASLMVTRLKKEELYFNKNDYIFFDSDVRYLRPGEIPTNEEKKFAARFEIIARHGAKFDENMDSENLKPIFSKKSWYVNCPVKYSRMAFDFSELNIYEVANWNMLCDNDERFTVKYVE